MEQILIHYFRYDVILCDAQYINVILTLRSSQEFETSQGSTKGEIFVFSPRGSVEEYRKNVFQKLFFIWHCGFLKHSEQKRESMGRRNCKEKIAINLIRNKEITDNEIQMTFGKESDCGWSSQKTHKASCSI